MILPIDRTIARQPPFRTTSTRGCLLLIALLATAPFALAQGGGGEGDAGGGPPQGPPPAMVRVAVAEQQKLQNHREVVGRLSELMRSTVAAEVSGRVTEVPVDEGDKVVKGQTVLARIDDIWTRLALDQAQASLDQAKARIAEYEAQVDLAGRDLERIEQLRAANSAQPKEVDDARALLTTQKARQLGAQAEKLSAEANLSRIREELERLTVVAPFDGKVVRKHVETGEWAAVGAPLVEVVSTGLIDAEIYVPESDINILNVGDEVEAFIKPLGMRVPGKVRAISPVSDNVARTFPVKVALDDQGGKLRAGMSVTAAVPTGEPAMHIVVPRDAVVRTATGDTVWINADGMAMPVLVDVLFAAGDNYAVATASNNAGPPLTPGTHVVIEGARRLFPTQPLIVQNEQELPANPANQGAPPRGPSADATSG